MARARTKMPETKDLVIDVTEFACAYSFGSDTEFVRRLKRDWHAIEDHQHLRLYGTVVAPDAQAGRDMNIVAYVSDRLGNFMGDGLPIDKPLPEVGEFVWGRARGASIWFPSAERMWNVAHGLRSGLLQRLRLTFKPPMRPSVRIQRFSFETPVQPHEADDSDGE